MTQTSIQWPIDWTNDPAANSALETLNAFIRRTENNQFIQTIDQTIILSGTSDVEFIPAGSVYLDGYIAGTALSLTVGDSSDVDGVLTAQTLSGLTRFDGAYLTTREEVDQDDTVIVTATGTETVRVVVFYYTPRI